MASFDHDGSDIEVDLTTLLDQSIAPSSSSAHILTGTLPTQPDHHVFQQRRIYSSSSQIRTPTSNGSKKYKYRKDPESKGSDAKLIFCITFGILTMISLLLITVYTIKTSQAPAIPSLYRHFSTFGPKYRTDEHNIDDETSKSNFFPSVWLPTVDRSTILETILSQTPTELWIPTTVLRHAESQANPDTPSNSNMTNAPVFTEDEVKNYLSTTYPSTSSLFISQQPQSTSFPLVLPSSKSPVSTYVDTQFTPIEPYYIIQFYAHWCGHCRRFSPHAEALAHTFNSNTQSPIRMLRVHCADSSPSFGQQLCQGLNINGYPSLYIATARTWLWILSQIMPEYHQRAQMWYVRSRGSQPEPGQENIDVSNVLLKPITKELLNTIITRIPSSASTAQLTIDWVNNWLQEQYVGNLNHHRNAYYSQFSGGQQTGEQFKLLQASAHNTFQVYNDYYSQYADVLTPAQRQTGSAKNEKKISFRIDDFTTEELSQLSEEERKVLYFDKQKKASDYIFDINNSTDLTQWQQIGLPLDDQIAYSIFPRSMLDGTNFFKNYKPTRYFDFMINLNVRPSLLAGLLNGMSVPLPVRYTVLSEDELRQQMLKDVSDTSSSPSSSQKLKTPQQQIFKNGYPDQSSLADKMLYWSIALRESIPQCQRVQHLESQNSSTTSNTSNNEEMITKMTKVEELLSMMKTALAEYSPTRYSKVPDELLFTPDHSNQSSVISNHADRVRPPPDTTKRGQYLQSQTCFESIYDMLDVLCTLSSKSHIPQQNNIQDYKTKYNQDNVPLEMKCQASFCALRDDITTFILPPQYTQQLYRIHTLTGRIAPTLYGSFNPNSPIKATSTSTTTSSSQAEDQSPSPSSSPSQQQFPGNWELCYQPWSHWDGLDWQQCKGSLPYTRGYTCALWLNLHSFSTTLDYQLEHNILPQTQRLNMLPSVKASNGTHNTNNTNNPEKTINPNNDPIPPVSKLSLIIRSYFKHFFPCAECQQHYLDYSNELPFLLAMKSDVPFISSLPLPGSNQLKDQEEKGYGLGYRPKELQPGEKDTRSVEEVHEEFDNSRPRRSVISFPPRQYFVLWLWNTHNIVNQRLAAVEKEHSAADPIFPKIYFPLHHKCPQCRDELLSSCSNVNNDSIGRSGSNGNSNNSVEKGASNTTHNCLWDDYWKYDQVYKYLGQFYAPAH